MILQYNGDAVEYDPTPVLTSDANYHPMKPESLTIGGKEFAVSRNGDGSIDKVVALVDGKPVEATIQTMAPAKASFSPVLAFILIGAAIGIVKGMKR